MPEKKEENNANLVFVLENSHKISSASPCFGNLPEPSIMVYFFLVIVGCIFMLELIFKQIMVMSPSNIEEHKVARGVILIKCCDLKVFKHLGWCERSSNPESSVGEVTEGTGGLSYPLRSCGNQLCFRWQFIGHIAQIRRSVQCSQSQPQCMGPQSILWPTDAYIAHKTGQCFFDLARSYLIGCLCATSESKGHTGFISLPCKQSCPTNQLLLLHYLFYFYAVYFRINFP